MRIGTLRGVFGVVKLMLHKLYALLGIVHSDELTDGSANTALLYHHGVLNALVENNRPYEVNVDAAGDVSSLGYTSAFAGWNYPVSAHVKRSGDDLVMFGYQFLQRPYVVYGVADAAGRMKLGPVEIDIPAVRVCSCPSV